MADTVRGFWPQMWCDDCGCEGTEFKHWEGPLVPRGQTGILCTLCFQVRYWRGKMDLNALPLGQKPPGEPSEFIGKAFSVKTGNSTYKFGTPDKNGVRSVVRERELSFSHCRILFLAEGMPMWLEYTDNYNEVHRWCTLDVEKIETWLE